MRRGQQGNERESKGHENGGRVGAEGAASEETNAAEKGLESGWVHASGAHAVHRAVHAVHAAPAEPPQYMMSTWLLCCGRCSARSLLHGRQGGQGSKFTRGDAARAAHTRPQLATLRKRQRLRSMQQTEGRSGNQVHRCSSLAVQGRQQAVGCKGGPPAAVPTQW